MKKAPGGDLAQHGLGFGREAPGQFVPRIAVKPAPRLEEVGAIQHPSHHVPACVPERMVANRFQHPSIRFAVRRGAPRGGGTVPKLGGTLLRRRPPLQFHRRRVAQGVVHPGGPEPSLPFIGRRLHGIRPAAHEIHHSLDMR